MDTVVLYCRKHPEIKVRMPKRELDNLVRKREADGTWYYPIDVRPHESVVWWEGIALDGWCPGEWKPE